MEDPWLPTVFNMLVDIPWQCPIIKDLIMDVSTGQALKDALSAFNPLAAQQCVLCRQGFSFSVCQAVVGNSSIYIKGLPTVLGGKGRLVCLTGCTKNAISVPKLANFLVHLFQVGLAWHTIVICHSAISTFLEPHCLHKASNHPVISKLMHHFYLQCLPSCKCFDPWDVEQLLL